ncbi:NADH-ubiquinone oxidoreductase-F iron-sulfur binding region domain-containing protein [Haloplanus sp. C73]|uniref:NADH-ubiquinone oxidoreductase-F iron-sulfur binding region domain-containing protein n=1 Tax=Haloplanus sp. C73 TaxID=3421641 RepID=UPI003EBB7D1C
MTHTPASDEAVVRISATEPIADVSADTPVFEVGSTGLTRIEPLAMVTLGERTAFYVRCSTDRVSDLAAALPDDFERVASDADAVVEHDATPTQLPVPPLDEFPADERRVLAGCGWRRPTSVADHDAAGGFRTPDAQTVFDVGEALRGRGWGDWCRDEPVRETWETVRDADGESVVVVNAHGSETDRLLLTSAPFEVLDGASALARSVDAGRIVVYVSEADERAIEVVRDAADAYPTPAPAFEVVTGPAEHRAAEPTMALEAIEGNHRLEARLRPPGPDEVGLDGRPTAVHTARTLAHLSVALRDGDVPRTRLLRVTGDVDEPATVELPETARLGAVRDAVAGDEVKAACVGGRFGGLTDTLDVRVDPESLQAEDLGTEGVVHLLSADRCLVEFVGRRARFAAEENCGRCVPCREGTTQLAELLRDIYDGQYDRAGIEELVRVMSTSSICTFGVDAGRPARTALDAFESEFRAHADGRCPAGCCFDTLEVT